ncbi:hypothetical protein [Mycolicibacterium vaccae]|uniref:hypothetical protein n=1 Tax=Mycolicibacterium vaccae TaxID=1810 RepID=UPI003CFD9618
MTDADQAVEPESDCEETQLDTEEAARPKRQRLTRRRIVAGTGAVVLASALGGAAVLGWEVRNQRIIDDAAAQALDTAQRYAVTLTAVDAEKLDNNFAAVLDGATGEFKDMYQQSSAGLKQVLVDNKAKATGTVVAAGIKSATPTKVEVLLFVDQSVTNALNPEPRLDRSRLIMTMEKVDNRWLASDVELP